MTERTPAHFPRASTTTKRKQRLTMGKATYAVPFTFQTIRRTKKTGKAGKEYVSLKTRVDNFFHKYRGSETFKCTGTLTGPFSPPQLSTGGRSRKCTIVTREERELEELKNYQPFKARPVNRKIMASCGGEYGVPRVEKRKITTFKEFKLSSSNKATSRKSISVPKKKYAPFKAKPFNPKIFKTPPKIQKAATPLTKPVSPNLQTGKNGEKYLKQSHKKVQPKTAVNASLGLTTPKEFHLQTEQRGKQHKEAMNQKIKDEHAEMERKRRPVANPMPRYRPLVMF